MRLIDCDDAIINFCFEWDDIPPTREEVIAFLKNRPDAVVRCRECASFEEIGKYPTNKGGTSFGYCYHWQYEQGMSPNEVDGNDFCSYGERKVDENGRT